MDEEFLLEWVRMEPTQQQFINDHHVRDEVLPTNPAREVKKPKLDMAPKTPWLVEGK